MLPWWFSGKKSACNTGDMGPILGSGRSSREGNGSPLQYSCLGNPTDRGAWWATVLGVTKESDTTKRLNKFLDYILEMLRAGVGGQLLGQMIEMQQLLEILWRRSMLTLRDQIHLYMGLIFLYIYSCQSDCINKCTK